MNLELEEQAYEIDHFKPTSKGGPHTAYHNLFLACGRCNHHKWDWWPGESEQARGVRYLNCCEEWDYGKHLFERADGTLASTSPAGEYHIWRIRLNRPDLVSLRLRRRRLLERLRSENVQTDIVFGPTTLAVFCSKFAELEEQLNKLIPEIPGPPEAPFHN